jgi:hypothetical protein
LSLGHSTAINTRSKFTPPSCAGTNEGLILRDLRTANDSGAINLTSIEAAYAVGHRIVRLLLNGAVPP